MNWRNMSSTVSGKIGKWIVLAVGMSASGTIWLREHWLDMIVGVAMWSIGYDAVWNSARGGRGGIEGIRVLVRWVFG